MQDKMRDSAFIVVGFILLAGIMVVMIIGVRGGQQKQPSLPKPANRVLATLAHEGEPVPLAPYSSSTGRRSVLPERGVPATLRPVSTAEGVNITLREAPSPTMDSLVFNGEFWVVELTKRKRLFYAIRMVESEDNALAVGDNGRSKGAYQCGKAAWKDACKQGNIEWEYETYVWSPMHCELIMDLYWERYGAFTDEQKARTWNGGPTMQGTDEYWAKVKSIMESN